MLTFMVYCCTKPVRKTGAASILVRAGALRQAQRPKRVGGLAIPEEMLIFVVEFNF